MRWIPRAPVANPIIWETLIRTLLVGRLQGERFYIVCRLDVAHHTVFVSRAERAVLPGSIICVEACPTNGCSTEPSLTSNPITQTLWVAIHTELRPVPAGGTTHRTTFSTLCASPAVSAETSQVKISGPHAYPLSGGSCTKSRQTACDWNEERV